MIGARKLLIGFGAGILLLALFALTVDIGRMTEELAKANYLWLIPATAMYLTSVLFRALRWQVLLRHLRPIRLARLYPVVVIGYMANDLLPMRLGELVRSYYVGEREGISKTAALATILVERVLDALTLLLFIAAIALFVPLSGVAESFGDRFGVPGPLLVFAFSAPFAAALSALIIFALYPERTWTVASILVRPLPDRIKGQVRDLVRFFLDGLQPLRSPRTLAVLFLISVPIWLCEAALFFLIGFSFGLEIVFDSLGELAVAAVLVMAVSNLGSSIPATPGGVGLFELVARETLVLLPFAVVDRSVAAGYAAVVHAALLLPMIVGGQIFLWAHHASLGSLSRAGRAETSDRAATSRRPSGLAPATTSPEPDEPQ